MNLKNLEKMLKNRLDIYHSRIASDCDNILEAEIAQLLEKIENLKKRQFNEEIK